MSEVKQLIEEQGRTFSEFKQKVDQELAEIKTKGVASPETKAAIDAMNARFDEIETKLARSRALLGPRTEDQPAQKSKLMTAVEKYYRFGMKGAACLDHMDAEEKAEFSKWRSPAGQKDIVGTSDSGGGYFIPEDFQATVIKKVANLAGVSAMVSHQQTSRDVLRWPKVNYTTDNIFSSGLTMTWEDESDTSTSTDFSPIGSVSIPIKRARGLVKIDRELLEDSAVDVMALLSSLISDNINVTYDQKFTKGAGGKEPEGFMTNTDILTTNSGSSGAFTADGLMSLVYALPEQYTAGAQFMVPRVSQGLIRKLKDGQGRYLWEPNNQAGTPPTLLGYPIRSNEHIAAAAAAAHALIFADFKRLYMVGDKVGLAVQRLDEKYADTDQVGFIYRVRVGGAVVAPWAGQVQVLS